MRTELPDLFTALLGLSLLLFGGAAMAAAPKESALQAETDAWHLKRIERLRAEDSWLALVGLHWLEEGGNAAGSEKGLPVELPASAPKRLGVFKRSGKSVSFIPEKGVKVEAAGKPFTGGPLKPDDAESPDFLRIGTLKWVVILRGERVGVRVWDAQAPTRTQFKGINRFPVNAAWRKEARFEPATDDRKIAVPNVLGDIEEMPLAGAAVFKEGDKEFRLEAVREGEKLFFIFGDQTNRKESYGAGRFLYADAPKDGLVVVDFNRAYNPPCAFTSFATCPLPPKGNRLPIRVEAGELRAGDH